MGKGIFEKIRFLFDCLLEVIYQEPYMCILCGKELEEKTYICTSCEGNFNKVCTKVKIEQDAEIFIDECIAIYEFKGKVREIVHDLKYKGKRDRAELIAYLIYKNINLEADLITWVPQSNTTYNKRGYNQARDIAECLSKLTGLKCEELLLRVKQTKSQVLLSGAERWYNVCDAFCAKRDLKGINVLIVDDVVTTGATLNFCSKALKQKGAHKVYAVCFAKSC
ncbi:ComF family protein [Thermobrachium celere]|uniref:ComF family protein n=1 Tax=Thermobrachium celere TaxID=53422 RepID=UPI001943FC9C|nr:ComF family protein [Thermobrachium celere]